jgi:hypothetical protein
VKVANAQIVTAGELGFAATELRLH